VYTYKRTGRRGETWNIIDRCVKVRRIRNVQLNRNDTQRHEKNISTTG